MTDYLDIGESVAIGGDTQTGDYQASKKPRYLDYGVDVEEAPQPTPTVVAEKTEPFLNKAARRTGDLALSGAQGAVDAVKIPVGIADLFTEGAAGKAAEAAGFRFKDANRILDDLHSTTYKAQNAALENAQGFTDTLSAALDNPEAVAGSIGRSAAPMLAGSLIARGGLGLAGLAGKTAAERAAPFIIGAGEGVTTTGITAEDYRADDPTGTLTDKNAAAAVGAGATNMLISAGFTKLAKSLGFTDVDELLAKGRSDTATAAAIERSFKDSAIQAAKTVLGTPTEEGAEELVQSSAETLWDNWSKGKPLFEGVGHNAALGLVTGAAMGAGGGAHSAYHDWRDNNDLKETQRAQQAASQAATDTPQSDAIEGEYIPGERPTAQPRGNATAYDEPVIDNSRLLSRDEPSNGATTGNGLNPPEPPDAPSDTGDTSDTAADSSAQAATDTTPPPIDEEAAMSRLATLEIQAADRDLTPSEQAEYAALSDALTPQDDFSIDAVLQAPASSDENAPEKAPANLFSTDTSKQKDVANVVNVATQADDATPPTAEQLQQWQQALTRHNTGQNAAIDAQRLNQLDSLIAEQAADDTPDIARANAIDNRIARIEAEKPTRSAPVQSSLENEKAALLAEKQAIASKAKSKRTPLQDERLQARQDDLNALATVSGRKAASATDAPTDPRIAAIYQQIDKAAQLSKARTQAAVGKALAGEPLTAQEKRSVTAMLDALDRDEADTQKALDAAVNKALDNGETPDDITHAISDTINTSPRLKRITQEELDGLFNPKPSKADNNAGESGKPARTNSTQPQPGNENAAASGDPTQQGADKPRPKRTGGTGTRTEKGDQGHESTKVAATEAAETQASTDAAPDKTEAVSDSKPTKPATAQQQAETVANDDNPLNLSAERRAELWAEMAEAIDELAALLGTKTNLTEEEETRIIPIVSKMFRAAVKLGYLEFKDAAKVVIKQIRKLAGDETADKLGIENLQGAYINLPKEIAGNKAEAMAFESIGQLMTADVPAAFWAETRIDTVDADSGTTTAAKAGALLDQVQRDARAYEQFMECVRGL